MIVLRSIINHYDDAFFNAQTLPIIDELNENERKAVNLIRKFPDLNDDIMRERILKNIYGRKGSNSTYRSFISTLESKFIWIASLLIYDGTKLENTRSVIHKEYLAFYHMGNMGLRVPSFRVGHLLYKKAIKYQCYDVALNTIALMEQEYNVSGGKKQDKIIERLRMEYEEVNEKVKNERSIYYKFGELRRRLRDKETKPEDLKDMFAWTKKAEKLLPTSSAKFHFFYYQIQLKLHEGEDYAFWCTKALIYFENLYFKHESAIDIFRRRLLQHKFENGDTSIKTIRVLNSHLDSAKLYSRDWFRFAHSLVKVYLNIRDIRASHKIIDRVFRSSAIKYVAANIRNEWKIIRMYWRLTAGKFDEVNIRKIRQALSYSAVEKNQENIPFLIGEVLYFLKIGEMDQDRRINHLRKLFKKQYTGNEQKRGIDFCNALQNGRKFTTEKSKTSFETEYVFYENLLTTVLN